MADVHEGNDFRIEDFIADQTEGMSEIAEFYANKKIFITGGTGFMGSILVEKLLRSCPDLDRIYLLIRGKKGKSLEERFKEQFCGPVFDRLRAERPEFQLQVFPIEGDCSQPQLGLSDETREKLRDVNVVFHVAATVRFDEKMRLATAINVKATVDMLQLAREMKDLKAFIHVSTAYSYPQQQMIEEKFYEPDISYERLINIVNNMDDAMLDAITPQLLSSWPNTYAFTKAVGENAVKRLGTGLPVAMVRPSIVISTAREPIAGWINNVYGPTGVVAGAGLGLLHTLWCDEKKVADMVPVDMAINSIVAAAWDIGTSRDNEENSEVRAVEAEAQEEEAPVVYNYVSSVDSPITWGNFMKLNARGVTIPSVKCVWYYDFRVSKYYAVHMLYVIFLHMLPAILVDLGCRLVGKPPFLRAAYKKIHKFSHVIAYFCTHEWHFTTDNVHKLNEKLCEKDRQVFDFDCRKLVWEQYLRTYMRGLRVYLVHDPLDTLPQARKKYQKLKIIHYAIKWSIRILVLWLFLQVLKRVF